MKTHQAGPTCWECINRFVQYKDITRTRANILSRRNRVFRLKNTTREQRMETYEMLDNTANDLAVSIRWLQEAQNEHMKEIPA